ncbi:MAG: patatin-like phospholipase family protein [Arcobacteraceae bacterium]|nr:patatin-like phospholipase family protein [Arcobacteraceae bacterium]
MIKIIIGIILLIVNCYSIELYKGNNVENKNNRSIKTVSLALGSGGARGYAHIGVIEELENQGYKIESIAGSSMGALIGGLYAVGKLDEFKKWVFRLDYYDIYKLINLSSIQGGLVDASQVFDRIALMIGDVNIEDLPIKYTAVATDLTTQKEVLFTEGRLIDAIRASISIPTIFEAVIKDDMILVDGGVINPLPINVIALDDTHLKIAVNMDANIKNKYNINIPKEYQTSEEILYDRFTKFIEKAEAYVPKQLLQMTDTRNLKEIEIAKRPNKDIFFILGRTVDIAQGVLSKYSIQNYKADIIINISRESCEFYQFTKAYKMIEIGKIATRDTIK